MLLKSCNSDGHCSEHGMHEIFTLNKLLVSFNDKMVRENDKLPNYF